MWQSYFSGVFSGTLSHKTQEYIVSFHVECATACVKQCGILVHVHDKRVTDRETKWESDNKKYHNLITLPHTH